MQLAIANVSVVIPAYRAAGTIRRAVDSVLQQTVPAAEILVIDDGSPDGEALAAALRPYGTAVTLLRKPNGGAAGARNHGIDHARQDWLAFLDADDYWEKHKLERQLEVVAAHPEVRLVGCGWYVEEPGQPRHDADKPHGRFDQVLQLAGPAAFAAALQVWTGGVLVHREALNHERFVPGLEPAEDRDLWVRLLAAHPAYFLSDRLATYVQEPGGISRTNIDRDCGSMLKVVRRHAALLGPAGVRIQEAEVHRRWASVYLSQGQMARAIPHALQRLEIQPWSLQAWWIVLKSAVRGAYSHRLRNSLS